MQRRARRLLLFAGACAELLGCRPETARVAQAAERAQPHLASFNRFERWARRAAMGDAALRDRAALGEVVFAPIRNTPELLAAWVELADDRALRLSLPRASEPPKQPGWVALRDAKLGALQVAALAPCPIALPSGWRPAPPAGCVLIARAARERSALNVTMAFGY